MFKQQSVVVEVCHMLAAKVQHIMAVVEVVVVARVDTDPTAPEIPTEIIHKRPPDMEQPQ
jgi:hypothetical protein